MEGWIEMNRRYRLWEFIQVELACARLARQAKAVQDLEIRNAWEGR